MMSDVTNVSYSRNIDTSSYIKLRYLAPMYSSRLFSICTRSYLMVPEWLDKITHTHHIPPDPCSLGPAAVLRTSRRLSSKQGLY